MKNDAHKLLWNDLLKLRKDLRESGFSGSVQLAGKIKIGQKSQGHHFVWRNQQLSRGSLALDENISRFLELYLPFCFIYQVADKRKYSWSVAHFAQTLDGKIATHVGHSQWIGNRENLVHAHRMRALCDAVIIGAGTLERDKPQLTVRHVKGPTPCRVIIGSGEYDIKCLQPEKGSVYQITNQPIEGNGAEQITIETGEYDDISCKQIMSELYKRDIKTVYIEGGSYTSSRFLEENILDEVQLHIAPLIVGSGINNFSLPLKDHLDQSIQFKKYHYFHMGNEIMFQGEIKH